MSKQPGPRSTPSSTDERVRASEPIGHTVSWCAEHQDPRRAASPKRQRRWVRPSTTMRSGATPSRVGADPRDHVGRAGDGGEVGRRRLALDELAQVGEQLVEGRRSSVATSVARLFGVARAPKWTYSSPVGSA